MSSVNLVLPRGLNGFSCILYKMVKQIILTIFINDTYFLSLSVPLNHGDSALISIINHFLCPSVPKKTNKMADIIIAVTNLYITHTTISPFASHVVNLFSFSFQVAPTTGAKEIQIIIHVLYLNTHNDEPLRSGSL